MPGVPAGSMRQRRDGCNNDTCGAALQIIGNRADSYRLLPGM